jgi:spore coat polysaccharide biosynthesis protein SpsF (cytidylyltransferase family)
MLQCVWKAAMASGCGRIVAAAPVGQQPKAQVLPELYYGSELDVASRFYHCARWHDFTHIIRLTADCPLVDPQTIIAVRDECLRTGHYAGRCNAPDGDDAEAFTFAELEEVFKSGPSEHVTTLMRAKHPPSVPEMPGVRYSVDTPEDLERVRKMVARVGLNAGREKYIAVCKELMP